jgi:hypothetical protein
MQHEGHEETFFNNCLPPGSKTHRNQGHVEHEEDCFEEAVLRDRGLD